MKNFIPLIISLGLLLLGCSEAIIQSEINSQTLEQYSEGRTTEWMWGNYTIAISEDHTQAEVVPFRNSSLHLNVNKFVEGPPCPNCLTIGKPQLQGDGTFKLKVWLRHPFPGQPRYTGFDVRGIVIFTATDYYETHNYSIASNSGAQNVLMYHPIFNYSDPAKGGAGLLNADGYTFYLNPLLEYVEEYGWPPPDPIPEAVPILNYYKGKYAYGDSPDCTINPYILFSDGSPRRMFKVNDFMSRTYHIKPPEGEGPFEFGYVVHACWAQPTNLPVTDPETDFPVEANCEDPYSITVEQLQPVAYDVAWEPVFKATIKHRIGEWPTGCLILAPTISTSAAFNQHENPIRSYRLIYPEDINFIDDETTEVLLRISQKHMDSFGGELVPGYHLGIFQSLACGKTADGEGYYSQLYSPLGVCPVMVYVDV